MTNAYIGAAEARALVGRHHHLLAGHAVGSDVQIPAWQGYHAPHRDAYDQWRDRQSQWGGYYGNQWGGARPGAVATVQRTGQPGATVNVQSSSSWREPTQREWNARPRTHSWGERRRRKEWWEKLYPGIPFVGAEAIVDATIAQGVPLFGPGLSVTGYPGASSVGHGPYGDPHGSRGWGQRDAATRWGRRNDRLGQVSGGGPGQPLVGANPLVAAAAQYGIPPRAALVPAPDPTMANRQVLPMNTGGQSVGVGLTAIITSRPQRVAFRPERVFISAAGPSTLGAAAWLVNDITIGNRSQYVQQGALPGDMFAPGAIDSFITFETAQTAMDVTMSVTFNDATVSEGEPFYGSLIGTAAMNAM